MLCCPLKFPSGPPIFLCFLGMLLPSNYIKMLKGSQTKTKTEVDPIRPANIVKFEGHRRTKEDRPQKRKEEEEPAHPQVDHAR